MPLSRTKRRLFIVCSLMICDALTLGLAFLLAFWLRFRVLAYYAEYHDADYRLLAITMTVGWILIFIIYGLYDQKSLFGGLKEYSLVFNAVTTGILASVLLDFVSQTAVTVSRGWLVLAWGLSIFLVFLERFGYRRIVYFLRQRGCRTLVGSLGFDC